MASFRGLFGLQGSGFFGAMGSVPFREFKAQGVWTPNLLRVVTEGRARVANKQHKNMPLVEK